MTTSCLRLIATLLKTTISFFFSLSRSTMRIIMMMIDHSFSGCTYAAARRHTHSTTQRREEREDGEEKTTRERQFLRRWSARGRWSTLRRFRFFFSFFFVFLRFLRFYREREERVFSSEKIVNSSYRSTISWICLLPFFYIFDREDFMFQDIY